MNNYCWCSPLCEICRNPINGNQLAVMKPIMGIENPMTVFKTQPLIIVKYEYPFMQISKCSTSCKTLKSYELKSS